MSCICVRVFGDGKNIVMLFGTWQIQYNIMPCHHIVFLICQQVATQLSMPDLQDLCYIYMVGGFCASPLLQDAIREEFDDPGRDLKVVVAPRPGLAVVS